MYVSGIFTSMSSVFIALTETGNFLHNYVAINLSVKFKFYSLNYFPDEEP